MSELGKWALSLQRASFRDRLFFVDSHDSSFGRRNVVHEFPLREKPVVEDLGRKAREFTIEAYVLANRNNEFDYTLERDLLIAALEEPGPGKLVHPYLGEMQVAVTGGGRLRETSKEGGMARFTLTFTEAGEVAQPTAETATGDAVDAAADVAANEAAAEYAENFSTDGQPQFVEESAFDKIKGAFDKLDGVRQTVNAKLDEAQAFVATLQAASSDIAALIRSPVDMANRVKSLFRQLGNLANGPLDSIRMLRQFFDFGGSGNGPRNTPARQQEAKNLDALAAVIRTVAVVEAVRTSSVIEYASSNDATAVRNELADRLDDLMAEATSDSAYLALRDLHVALVRDVAARGADLARLVSYTPPATVPALLLAHQLYGDATRDLEIVARNRIPHPGFVSGGRPLEVLSDL